MGDTAMIPYYAHEGEMNRMERVNKRLWIAVLLMFLALVGTNIGWIVYESQFTDVVTTETYTALGSGTAVANGEGSVVINGIGGGNEDYQSTGQDWE